MVSHCPTISKREDYVTELQKYIPVDVYGKCGTLDCPPKSDCRKMIARDYKFYLAFENSKCLDYATEKLFDTLRTDIVPVVMGGANYSAIAPSGSFIDTRDFGSPKALAEELLRLANNTEEYMQHFWWKVGCCCCCCQTSLVTKYPTQEHYKVEPGNYWCDLCRALHEDRPPSSYGDLAEWWGSRARCER
jgi:alpha-1,3-fucosyltransferase